jgi:tRNA pseudouridine38-40 synthase
MVRSLVGALVEIGLGRRMSDDLRKALTATERAFDGRLGPPQGLTLWHIRY